MNPIERALAALRACEAQLAAVATTGSPTTAINIGAARMMAKASIVELEKMRVGQVTPPQPKELRTDLNKLFEDSWTCRCDKCNVRSYHDSDIGKACIKAPLCDGKMEGRMAIDLRADRDARR